MIIEKILGWLGYKGSYRPFYFNKYNTINPPYEMIIVPGVGALLCLATEGMDYIDTAFFYRQQDAIESLYKYFNQLSSQTEPLLRIFNVDNYFEEITKIDKKLGDVFHLSVDLEFISIPYSLWLKHLNRTIKDEAEISIHAKRIQKRINSFHKQVEKYKFKSIYSVEAIEHLIEKGEYLINNIYTKATKEDIVENLSYLIYLLKKYDNFEVALINYSQSYLIPQNFWRVKGDYNAMISFWGLNATLDNVNETGLFLEINEGTISSAFKDYFIEIWEKRTPKFRDKKYIISWLEAKITLLMENDNI